MVAVGYLWLPIFGSNRVQLLTGQHRGQGVQAVVQAHPIDGPVELRHQQPDTAVDERLVEQEQHAGWASRSAVHFEAVVVSP